MIAKKLIEGEAGNSGRIYHCGTLTYTKAGLISLFAWLAWGGFCFVLMETVVPSIMPLRLKSLGCSNTAMALVISIIPSVMSMTVTPYISFKSDRYRSRWGRRLPFIIWTMPFLCASLALLGFSDNIALWFRSYSQTLQQYPPGVVTLGTICVFLTMFSFFNMFVGSVFWFLFNDVVPAQFLGRFTAMFRVIGAATAMIYQYFIFEYAESNMREILVGAALLYLIGFGIMCFMIREGSYPPFEEVAAKKKSRFHFLSTFAQESFTIRFYWLVYLAAAAQCIPGAVDIFGVFFFREMGLSLKQIGIQAGIGAFFGLLATYFTANCIDRWHPMRVSAYAMLFAAVGFLMNWVWVFVSLPGIYFFWLSTCGSILMAYPLALLNGVPWPREMRIFPRSRFGQFLAAQSTFRALIIILANVAAGGFMDLIKWACGGSDFAYRYYNIWKAAFFILLAVFGVAMYRKWHALGGDAGYHPIAPWNQSGVEELEIVPTIGPRSRYLELSLRLFSVIMISSAATLLPLSGWMYYRAEMTAFYGHVIVMLPLSIAVWLVWRRMVKGIRRDVESARAGRTPRYGIPHHGVFLISAVQFLLTVPLWIGQTVVAVNLHQEWSAIIFTAANIITNLALIGVVMVMRRMERGYSRVVDVDPVPEKKSETRKNNEVGVMDNCWETT